MAELSGFATPFGSAIVPGGAAGFVAQPVSGVDAGDSLLSVLHLSPVGLVLGDLVAEFTILAADKVEQDGATPTATTGDFLLFVWKEER